MKPGARAMLRLRRGPWLAFAERENRQLLLDLRRTDPRLKRGRITEVLQCGPTLIEEGVVYPENRH